MTEKNLASDLHPLSDEAAAENLAFFYHKMGAVPADIQSTSEFNRHVIAEVPLALRLESLHAQFKPASERDKLVSYFEKNNWLPKQRLEANIAAAKGVDETLRRASHTSQGDQTEAQIATYGTINRYYKDAIHDVKTLNLVRTIREGQSMLPNIDSLRVSRPALYTMADILLAREFLDNAQWANSNWKHYVERQHYWRGFMLFAADYARDDALKQGFNNVYEKAQNRRRFWSEEYRQIDRKIGHLITEKHATVGISGEDLEDETGPETPFDSKRPTDWEEIIPEGAQKDLERAINEYADKSAQIDRYVNDQGMLPEEAERRVLQGKALRYKGHVVGVEEKDSRDSIASRPSQKPSRSDPKSYRARFSDTDDHAAAEQRSALAVPPDVTSGPEEPGS